MDALVGQPGDDLLGRDVTKSWLLAVSTIAERSAGLTVSDYALSRAYPLVA
jgi:hypothetical protein